MCAEWRPCFERDPTAPQQTPHSWQESNVYRVLLALAMLWERPPGSVTKLPVLSSDWKMFILAIRHQCSPVLLITMNSSKPNSQGKLYFVDFNIRISRDWLGVFASWLLYCWLLDWSRDSSKVISSIYPSYEQLHKTLQLLSELRRSNLAAQCTSRILFLSLKIRNLYSGASFWMFMQELFISDSLRHTSSNAWAGVELLIRARWTSSSQSVSTLIPSSWLWRTLIRGEESSPTAGHCSYYSQPGGRGKL